MRPFSHASPVLKSCQGARRFELQLRQPKSPLWKLDLWGGISDFLSSPLAAVLFRRKTSGRLAGFFANSAHAHLPANKGLLTHCSPCPLLSFAPDQPCLVWRWSTRLVLVSLLLRVADIFSSYFGVDLHTTCSVTSNFFGVNQSCWKVSH